MRDSIRLRFFKTLFILMFGIMATGLFIPLNVQAAGTDTVVSDDADVSGEISDDSKLLVTVVLGGGLIIIIATVVSVVTSTVSSVASIVTDEEED